MQWCKCLVLFSNLLIFLSGAMHLAVGIWVLTSAEALQDAADADQTIFITVYVLIGIGGLLALIGFIGCFGALRESGCLLIAYVFILLFIIIIELVSALLAFVMVNSLEQTAREAMVLYGTETEDGVSVTQAWDAFQKQFDCCGIDGYSDWIDAAAKVLPRVLTPPEPCSLVKENTPCRESIQRFATALVAVAFPVLALEVGALLAAGCVYRGLERDE